MSVLERFGFGCVFSGAVPSYGAAEPGSWTCAPVPPACFASQPRSAPATLLARADEVIE